MRRISSCGQRGRPARHRREAPQRRAGIGQDRRQPRMRGAVQVDDERGDDADEDRELERQGERREERHREDHRLAAVRPQHAAHLLQVDQAGGDEEQQARHDRERQVAAERRDHEHDRRERDRGEDRGERRLRAGFVVDAAAVERAGRRVGRRERAGEVRQALAEELLVAVDPLARAERDRARDRHRLGEPEHGERQCRGRELRPDLGVERRQRQRRQAVRQRADRRHLRDAEGGDQRGEQAPGEHAGDHRRQVPRGLLRGERGGDA